jgi:hypothetical protein
VRLDQAVVDRRQQHADRADHHDGEERGREPVGRPPRQQQVDGALRERRTAQQRTRDVPRPEHRLRPAERVVALSVMVPAAYVARPRNHQSRYVACGFARQRRHSRAAKASEMIVVTIGM